MQMPNFSCTWFNVLGSAHEKLCLNWALVDVMNNICIEIVQEINMITGSYNAPSTPYWSGPQLMANANACLHFALV